ncbi:protocadherin alpha-12-like isoform X2 [Triplophysa rosa]|uniref:protocadherin alpha-12-like isoform X2 n=1 Tax=Triplophysa rosa TaxID=992332 RepID=UPI002545FE92|nr:protocadherin alpha-12-like isoform X2 [Triplophysa rosa]
MEARRQRRRWEYCWIALCFSLLLSFGTQVCAQIRYTIPEELKEGSVVGHVAKDLGLDVSTLVNRKIRIVSGAKDALFQVNQNNGVLYVYGKIDREELCDGNGACSINLKMAVEEPLEIHYVGVEITDVNDNPPTFSEDEQHFEIAEHTPTGTRFQIQAARDADTKANNVRSYKLSQNEHFEVDTKDRHEEKIPFLVLKKSLDRENTPEHRLILTAIDGGNPPRSGTLNIIITVLDINDNRPVFSEDTYSVTVRENAAQGTVLIRLNATDLDKGSNGAVEYAFGRNINRKLQSLFKLDSITGEIQIKGELDYEETEVFKLDVQASDKGQPPLAAESVVIIKIIDINDNAPEIDLTSLSNVVSEDSKPGTVISLVSISDKDSGINGKIITTITYNVPFELKPSFQENVYSLVTKGRLDRELQSHYDITITVTDLGQPPLSAFKSLSVQVSDVNDNNPEFSQDPIELYIVENNAPGASIFSVIASDKDLNENAMITYNIIRGEGAQNDMSSFLNINSETGVIYALNRFDFEVTRKFKFQVLAKDSGTPSLSSNVTVHVFILDQNDNAPVILYPVSANGSAEGVEEISRNVNAGHLVTKVRAYDADIGYNGWLLFSLQEVSDHSLFSLDRYTGQIRTLRSFTETDEAQHKLVILVKDNGNVSLSATATVIVKVVEPKEAFAASDVTNSVKDEEENNVTFYLIITLGSVSVLFIISIIVLIVMQCSKSTDYSSKYLQDTNYDGTLCHSIQYRSGDKRYMLVGPRMSIGSTLAPGSNRNTLVIPDRRRRDSVEKSTAMEPRGQSLRWEYWWTALSFSLVLFVDHHVSAQIRYSVPEEVKEGYVVGNIAKDLGLDASTLVDRRFRIVSGSNDAFFQVTQHNGMLYVDKHIDRENVCEGNSACLINLKTVIENPLEVHYVEIEITDVNDHSPSFHDKDFNLEVWENAVTGTRFELQTARDLDAGVNSVRLYKLSKNAHFDLEIKDSVYGDKNPFLVLQKQLDRETTKMHRLLLTAIDGGNPPKSGVLNITVRVLDVNDNRPICNSDTLTITLRENSIMDTVVKIINASDADSGLNGEVEYTYGRNMKPKIHEIFQLDRTTGEILVKGLIDFEENDIYSLMIRASDKGIPPLNTDCQLIVKVEDVNDNKPEIQVTSLSNVVSEDAKIGTVISLISVSDKDSGINGKVVCSLSDNVPFELKQSVQDNMFSLVTKTRLDRERVSEYDIKIIATDLGNPPLSVFKSMRVQVSDVNDNMPDFFANSLELYLPENNAPGASIFFVNAFDKDINENAAITYHMIRGGGTQNDMASALNINSETGVIYALKSFDFETLKKFQFYVLATDSGSPSLSSNVTVNVFILDQNDNVPVILHPIMANGSAEGVEEIPRNVNAGHLVTKVRAYDADIGYNGWLLFSLQEVSDHSLFSLDRYTGQIRTLRSFTETDETQHKLVILVKDNGNISMSATATVIVKVVEPKEAFAASDVTNAVKDEEENNVTFYLIITLGSVSVLFIISIIVLVVMQCSKSTDYSSKYLQDTNYDGTLCHSIQYRSGDKRYMLVGPRMSIGSTLAPGSNRNTLVIPDRRRRDSGESTLRPRVPNTDWRYSASLRAGMQSSVHMEESSVMQGAQGVLVQNWPTVSSAADNEGGEVSPPIGTAVDSNSWHFRYGPGPGGPPPHLKPGEVPPEAFIIPGSPAIISIRQGQDGDDKSDFISFGKKDEKKKKKKKKEKKDKREKGKDDDD